MDASWGDDTLVRRLRAKDQSAFETLLRRYMARLLNVARRFLKNEEDARDAVQEAFISAFRGIDGFQSGSKLSTWLHRIVVNACLMKLRTLRRHPEEEIDALLPGFQTDGHQVRDSVPWSVTAEDLVEREETRELVRKSIDQLPDNYRVVLLM